MASSARPHIASPAHSSLPAILVNAIPVSDEVAAVTFPTSAARTSTSNTHLPLSGGGVLSFFDGIATAVVALKPWGMQTLLVWAWELDPAAIQVASAQHPELVNNGDAFAETPAEGLQALSQVLPKDTAILLCSAPTCHDFSPIRKTPPGTKGVEGAKFAKFATWLKTFLSLSPFKENVQMSASLQSELDGAVRKILSLQRVEVGGSISATALVVERDLATASWVSVTSCGPFWTSSLAQGQPYLGTYPKLFALRQVAASCPFASFHEDVVSGKLTAPADPPEGRDAPSSQTTYGEPTDGRALARSKQALPSLAVLLYRPCQGR